MLLQDLRFIGFVQKYKNLVRFFGIVIPVFLCFSLKAAKYRYTLKDVNAISMGGGGSMTAAGLFPIGIVSEQTGVNAVMLRAWERRYGLLKPQRTPKGHRLYTQQHIEQIKQVLALLKQGVSVSQVRNALEHAGVMLSTSLPTLNLADNQATWQTLRSHFSDCLKCLDMKAINGVFNEIAHMYSIDVIAENLLLPLYRQVSHQCTVLPATQVDLVMLHDFLCARLAGNYYSKAIAPTQQHILIGNLAGKIGQIYVLLLANVLVIHGYRLTFVGDMTVNDLPLTCQRIQPHAVVLLSPKPDVVDLSTVAAFLSIPVCVYDVGYSAPGNGSESMVGVFRIGGQIGEVAGQLQRILIDQTPRKS